MGRGLEPESSTAAEAVPAGQAGLPRAERA